MMGVISAASWASRCAHQPRLPTLRKGSSKWTTRDTKRKSFHHLQAGELLTECNTQAYRGSAFNAPSWATCFECLSILTTSVKDAQIQTGLQCCLLLGEGCVFEISLNGEYWILTDRRFYCLKFVFTQTVITLYSILPHTMALVTQRLLKCISILVLFFTKTYK